MVMSSAVDILSNRKITQRVVLHHVTWQTYRALLSELGDSRAGLLAYDTGILEITMPSDLHEINKHLLERIITALTEELNLSVRGVGSVTLNREDLQRGAEPDAGFYIQNASRIRGKKIDLANDPPPDLVVEVDISSPSRIRMPIYQQLRIPEIWRYDGQTVLILRFQSGEYLPCEYSPSFPMVSGSAIARFLEMAETEDDNTVIRSWRSWIREQLLA